MSDDDLKKQVDIMAEAFIKTFSTGSWDGSYTQHAAYLLDEMRGGTMMAEAIARRVREESEAATQQARYEARREKEEVDEATEFLQSLGYTVSKPTTS